MNAEQGKPEPTENKPEGVDPLVVTIDVFHYHEIVDRCSTICDLIDSALNEHPAMSGQMKVWAEDAQRQICNIMNLAAEAEIKFS